MRVEWLRREIKILLVDENREALESLSKQLNFGDTTIVGEAEYGPVAYTWATQLQPDVVLVAAEEPVARALKTVEALALGKPRWPVIVLSSLSDNESLRRAMVAGADDYLDKSSSPEQIRAAIVSLVRREDQRAAVAAGGGMPSFAGSIICVFGVKGGIGKTTLATNLAASIALETRQRVALVDLDLQFGDVALVMDAPPDKTISDVVESLNQLDADLLNAFLSKHNSGVRVLPAPLNFESAEKITGNHVRRLLKELASAYDYVVLDTPNTLNETVLAALEDSTLVLLLTTPEFHCLKRTKACLDLMKEWQYPEDKVKLVINKTNGRGASAEDIVGALRYPAFWKLPLDHAADLVTGSGGLLVQEKSKFEISRSIFELTRKLLGIGGDDGRGSKEKNSHKLFLLRR